MIEEFVREGIDSGFSKSNINLWAREAAASYVQDGTALNEKIAHIADKNSLNQEQIQRVVEATNLTVDSLKKGTDFELAKTASVMIIMKKPSCGCGDGSVSDYMSPPEGRSDMDLDELFGVKSDVSQPTIPAIKVIGIRMGKTAQAKAEIEGHLLNLNREKAEAEKELIKTAKQCIMGDRENINDLYKMMLETKHTKLASQYFPVINHVLVGQDVLEKNAFIAPDKYISKDLNNQGIKDIQIINGNHAVVKSFDTLSKINDDILHATRSICHLGDKIKKFKEEAKRIS